VTESNRLASPWCHATAITLAERGFCTPRRALENGEAQPSHHSIYPEGWTTLKNALALLLSAHAANRGRNMFHRELQQ
jgi:hypothetical protein